MKYLLIIAGIILMYGLAGADDAAIAKEAEQLCHEMATLFHESEGQLGWPEEVCK
jgi:hypothetical protein